jgi:hypothetical protein
LSGPRFWTCQRQAAGIKCGHRNPRRKQLCDACGKRRPATRQPVHLAVMGDAYETWVARFGETCGICGRAPSARRRLDRDHCHKTGVARGLLCARCNRALPSWVTADWLRNASRYLDRSAA